MLFNSYIFIALLSVFLSGYFLLNKFKKYTLSKVWLVLCSLFYYGYWNYKYLFIVVFSIVFNYFAGKFIIKLNECDKKKFSKALCFFSVLLNIGILFYYKYFDFIKDTANKILSTDLTLKNLELPLGISFFTFQQVSYILDSYKSNTPPPVYSFVDYSLFVTFFPQLIAGPIVLHDEILPQFESLENKRLDFSNLSKGILAFSVGLFKKVIIADNFGKIVDFGFSSISTLTSTSAFLTILGYTIQIYFDFSGYCDMASGVALMFNIKLPVNFDSPYKSLDIVDFWKRWHKTLTRFLTKYVYIPLGGNRKGAFRTYLNILIVFLASGIWHGAGWTFIVWGLMHGVASVLTRLFKKYIDKLPKFLRWILTFSFVSLSWVFFRAESLSDGVKIIGKLFSKDGFTLSDELSETLRQPAFLNVFIQILGVPAVYIIFAAVVIFLTSTRKNTNERIDNFKPDLKTFLGCLVIFIYSLFSLSGVSSFLYYNF